MAVYQIVAPYLADPSDKSWRGPMQVFRTRCQAALESLDGLNLSTDDRAILQAILERNLAFMNECLKAGTFTTEQLQQYARSCAPYFGKTIAIAARVQVAHWMDVVADWKKELGKDWERTYAVSNTIYVTRQNNILFTVLVQFMGEAAMGNRLLLLETTEFTTTPKRCWTSWGGSYPTARWDRSSSRTTTSWTQNCSAGAAAESSLKRRPNGG